ncbi:hypothetical protein ACP70R_014565 [Stipagrostis hirtigluma subsp. patula]
MPARPSEVAPLPRPQLLFPAGATAPMPVGTAPPPPAPAQHHPRGPSSCADSAALRRWLHPAPPRLLWLPSRHRRACRAPAVARGRAVSSGLPARRRSTPARTARRHQPRLRADDRVRRSYHAPAMPQGGRGCVEGGCSTTRPERHWWWWGSTKPWMGRRFLW